jgi:hypothetical protein
MKRSSMPHLSIRSRAAALAALPTVLLACGGLAACGSSKSTPSTTTQAANAASTTPAAAGTTTAAGATAPTAPAAGGASSGTSGPAGAAGSGAARAYGPTGPGAGRFAAVRECLSKNGVTLPRPGAAGAGPGFPGGARQLPKGMTQAQYRAALAKCGAGLPSRHGGFKGRAFNSPVFRTALTKFAGCLREQGIDVPAPNTSGKGPIFSTKGIDTSSPKFRAAEVKCRSMLLAGLRPHRGVATGGAGGGGAG